MEPWRNGKARTWDCTKDVGSNPAGSQFKEKDGIGHLAKFYDTCSLLNSFDDPKIFNDKVFVSATTLRELENIKTSKNKTEDVRWKARRVTKLLNSNADKFKTVAFTEDVASVARQFGLDPSIPDNQILASVLSIKDDKLTFVTDDLCLKNIARVFHVPVASTLFSDKIYKGYKVIRGNTETINRAMDGMDMSDWYENEYLIIENTDDNSEKEMRFNGSRFVSLKLPPSHFIKGRNALQRCALDMLCNPDITICSVLGGYGSGKTKLCMSMALYAVEEKGEQSTILGVREPKGEGEDIGFLPGTTDDKTGLFFLPLSQQLQGGEFQLVSLQQQGKLQTTIPRFMKGMTYDSTVMVCDEAEDFKESVLRLVGTRIGRNSRIFFAGDYKQSLVDKGVSNPLIKMCNEFKGISTFGCIYLEEDVRSSESKMFAHLFEDESI